MKIATMLHRLGLRADVMHGLGFASILGALSLWGKSAAMSGDRSRAERLAIFVGLWPPTFFLLGKVLQDLERTPEQQWAQAHGVEAKEDLTETLASAARE